MTPWEKCERRQKKSKASRQRRRCFNFETEYAFATIQFCNEQQVGDEKVHCEIEVQEITQPSQIKHLQRRRKQIKQKVYAIGSKPAIIYWSMFLQFVQHSIAFQGANLRATTSVFFQISPNSSEQWKDLLQETPHLEKNTKQLTNLRRFFQKAQKCFVSSGVYIHTKPMKMGRVRKTFPQSYVHSLEPN